MNLFYFVLIDGKFDKGPIRHIEEELKELVRKNNKVYLFCNTNCSIFNKDIIESIKYIRIPTYDRSTLLKLLCFNLFVLLYTSFYAMIRVKPTKIYYRMSAFCIAPLIVSKLLKVPLITEINGFLCWDLAQRNRNNFLINTNGMLEKIVYCGSHKLILVNKNILLYLKDQLGLEFSESKCAVIPNGTIIQDFTLESKSKVRKLLKLEPNMKYIVYLGSFADREGVDCLIRAFQLVWKSLKNVRLLLVGDGKNRSQISHLVNELGISDSVIFTGYLPYEEAMHWVVASDIGIHPRVKLTTKFSIDSQGSPLKTFDYMVAYLPIIVTDISYYHFVKEYKLGLTFKSEKHDDLADKILLLLRNPITAEKMGRNGRDYVIKYHDWNKLMRKWSEIICESI